MENPAREQKLASLSKSITTLQTQQSELEAELAELTSKLSSRQNPSTTVQRHIRLLHEYNEIKDVGQGLMGLIADAHGVRQIEVQKEFGVKEDD
ncbi:hypothetical protein NUU61_009607 [Penicillium alfredii]|uniref:DNA repair protein Swi5/Sae3 n=1 Tax=Penicillium alfredii TaxID=1506179 RepID=A0A9W9JTJ9_9EURO|nr:uncharacterized protein NUU61_009607 [Penicillium alfredii]KAJ5081343.1 hypothetical protein NUU61_009607 [Penicillium alfredii]